MVLGIRDLEWKHSLAIEKSGRSYLEREMPIFGCTDNCEIGMGYESHNCPFICGITLYCEGGNIADRLNLFFIFIDGEDFASFLD